MTNRAQMLPAAVGDRVAWVGTGKLAAQEGTVGAKLWGVVRAVKGEGDTLTYLVLPDHRQDEDAIYYMMVARVPHAACTRLLRNRGSVPVFQGARVAAVNNETNHREDALVLSVAGRTVTVRFDNGDEQVTNVTDLFPAETPVAEKPFEPPLPEKLTRAAVDVGRGPLQVKLVKPLKFRRLDTSLLFATGTHVRLFRLQNPTHEDDRIIVTNHEGRDYVHRTNLTANGERPADLVERGDKVMVLRRGLRMYLDVASATRILPAGTEVLVYIKQPPRQADELPRRRDGEYYVTDLEAKLLAVMPCAVVDGVDPEKILGLTGVERTKLRRMPVASI